MTEFELICDKSVFNALLTSIGLVGKMFGAFFSGMYTDRFGRKNAILVWEGIAMVFVLCQAFMPNEYGFLVFRALSSGAAVRNILLYSFWLEV